MSDVPRWLRDAGFVPVDDDGAWEPLDGRDLAALDDLVQAVAHVLAGPDPWHDVALPQVRLTEAQRRALEG